MNDRLMMLYQQAHVVDGQMTNKLNVNKFAELIARECAKLVEDNIDPQNAWITPAFIKEHFGVEE